jgi:DNA replication protein DnaC
MNYLYDAALITKVQRKHISLVVDKDGTDVKEFKILASYAADIESIVASGKNIYIHSPYCGNGKTSWALRMVEAYFNKIWSSSELQCRALFISVPQFLIALKSNITDKSDYVQYIKDNVAAADIVIWDDIATKDSTAFEAENLLALIDNRINNGKTNIFTSNLTDDEVHKALGDRLASRICNLSYNIELHGSDKRGLMYE